MTFLTTYQQWGQTTSQIQSYCSRPAIFALVWMCRKLQIVILDRTRCICFTCLEELSIYCNLFSVLQQSEKHYHLSLTVFLSEGNPVLKSKFGTDVYTLSVDDRGADAVDISATQTEHHPSYSEAQSLFIQSCWNVKQKTVKESDGYFKQRFVKTNRKDNLFCWNHGLYHFPLQIFIDESGLKSFSETIVFRCVCSVVSWL